MPRNSAKDPYFPASASSMVLPSPYLTLIDLYHVARPTQQWLPAPVIAPYTDFAKFVIRGHGGDSVDVELICDLTDGSPYHPLVKHKERGPHAEVRIFEEGSFPNGNLTKVPPAVAPSRASPLSAIRTCVLGFDHGLATLRA
jgi:hypothetical protein